MGFLDKAKDAFDKAGGVDKAKEMLDKVGGVDKVEDLAAQGTEKVDGLTKGKVPDQVYDAVDKIDGKDDLPPRPGA